MQHQNIDGNDINNSVVLQGNAGGNLSQNYNNTINETTNIYVGLVGQKQPQWTDRQRLILQSVQQDVETRLDMLNDDEVLIPLRLRDQGQGVSRASLKLRRKLITPQVQVQDLKQAILGVFCRADVQGRLLILGAPGGGKTTTLLTLAKELLAEAFTTPGTTIPVIFELSAWKLNKQTPTLRDWLIVQLQDLYNLQPQEGAQWLEEELLLPLLDGLDELGMEPQQQCIAAINAFAQSYPRVVVCCREHEYREGGAILDSLPGQICLEPLSDEQIEQYLSDLGLEALWYDIQSLPAMRPMLEPDPEGNPGILRVPLLLSMAAVTYDGQAFANRADLYDAYIEQRLHYDTRIADRKPRGNPDRRQWAFEKTELEPHWRQTQQTLRWLARQLQQNNTVELLIERIQPSWLEAKWARRRYRLIIGLIGWLIFGLIYRLIFGLTGLILGLIGWLSYGLIGEMNNIKPVEAFKILVSHEVRREVFEILKGWLICGLIFGLTGLILGLIFGLILGLIDELIAELIAGLIAGLTFLIYGLIGGLILGLIFGLIRLISELIGVLRQDLQLRSHPNQGIWKSFQNFLWTTALSYITGTIFFRYVTGTIFFKSVEPSIAMFLSALLFGLLWGGGKACFQHVCLRFVLWQSGVAPWNLARFLNYCVERKLLQRVGGRYRFLHRELLDHFAGQPPTV